MPIHHRNTSSCTFNKAQNLAVATAAALAPANVTFTDSKFSSATLIAFNNAALLIIAVSC